MAESGGMRVVGRAGKMFRSKALKRFGQKTVDKYWGAKAKTGSWWKSM